MIVNYGISSQDNLIWVLTRDDVNKYSVYKAADKACKKFKLVKSGDYTAMQKIFAAQKIVFNPSLEICNKICDFFSKEN